MATPMTRSKYCKRCDHLTTAQFFGSELNLVCEKCGDKKKPCPICSGFNGCSYCREQRHAHG